MLKKFFLIAFLSIGLLFLLHKKISAQANPGGGGAVNGNAVGPELADPQAGQSVVQAHSYTGTAAVINNIDNNDTPHNTATGAHVVLRLDLSYATDRMPDGSVNPNGKIAAYANALNNTDVFKNSDGKPTVIVFGIEFNNLDPQGYNYPGVTPNMNPLILADDLRNAAEDYALQFNLFSSIIHNGAGRSKYLVAPAAPDLYNSVYSASTWMSAFSGRVNCGLVDTLVADIFKLDGMTGTSWLDIYHTEEQAICGKKVTHFEGWGADPHASIQDQINFLKTQALPAGVSTGTTLIVDNCAGFGGNTGGNVQSNKPWLYWIPTTPDVVYDAQGNTVDPATCSGTGKQTQTQAYDPSQYIPCDKTSSDYSANQGLEFHSLRPYPANPCYKVPDETVLMCSNDLIVKKTMTLTSPGAPPGCVVDGVCSDNADGSVSCNYKCTGLQNKVSMDLTNAKLPIVGNTEDVPNATWTSINTAANNLTAAQRVNFYVSWYLNGVINRAEAETAMSADNSNVLVNFSGPLNKLLPWAVQFADRLTSIDYAAGTTIPQEARHNQIAGCNYPVDENRGYGAMPCYIDTVLNLFNSLDQIFPGLGINPGDPVTEVQVSEHRLNPSDRPPLESDDNGTGQKYLNNFPAYWRDLMGWQGQLCSPQLLGTPFYICLDNNTIKLFQQLSPTVGGLAQAIKDIFYSHANPSAFFFPYVPSSTTEDRVGLILTDQNGGNGQLQRTIQLPKGGGNGATVTNVSYTPDNTPANNPSQHNLFFAHMQEDSELAKLLQNTFATKSQTPGTDWEGELKAGVISQQNAPTYPGAGCVVQPQNVVDHPPGDKLYGNIDRTQAQGYQQDDHKISGILTYDAAFSCTFTTKTTCIPAGCSVATNPLCLCTTQTNPCNVDIYTSLSVYTKTPKDYELWQRLVGCDTSTDQPDPQDPASKCTGSGGMSIFKRFYPKPGLDSVLVSMKAIPAETTISYQSDANGTYAGKTGIGGDQAKIYFPYLGSMEAYFLKGIQKALRPKGMNCDGSNGQATTPTPPSSSPSTSDAVLSQVPGGATVTLTADAKNLVASTQSEDGQPTCSWGAAKNLAFSINANLGRSDGKTPIGPIGSGGNIQDNPLVNPYDATTNPTGIHYRSFWIDGGGAHIGDVPGSLSGIQFIVTGVDFNSFNGSSHTGPEPRTMIGLNGGRLYLVALSTETPASAQKRMQDIMGLPSLDATYNDAFFLDSDTSTNLCQGSTSLVGGNGTPATNMGVLAAASSNPNNPVEAECDLTLPGQNTIAPTITSNPIPGQINCDQTVPDSTIPAVYLNLKNNFVDLATRWTSGTGKSYAKECFNDVIKRSLASGVNPIFSLAIWLHESGASNYTSNVTSSITQDFGINGGGIPPSNFNAQITTFLSLPSGYKINHPQCFTSAYTPMQNFYHIYRTGANLNDQGVCGPTPGDLKYDQSILQVWNWIVGGHTTNCPYPDYPTNGTCS